MGVCVCLEGHTHPSPYPANVLAPYLPAHPSLSHTPDRMAGLIWRPAPASRMPSPCSTGINPLHKKNINQSCVDDCQVACCVHT